MSNEPDELEFTDEPHRWTIEPHPSCDFDNLVTNSDGEARYWILEIAESHLWDTNEGEERTMRVTMNPEIANVLSPSFDTSRDLAAPIAEQPSGPKGDETVELKPCRFCGSIPVRGRWFREEGKVHCSKTSCVMFNHAMDIKDWNTDLPHSGDAVCEWSVSRHRTIDTQCGRLSVRLPMDFRKAMKFCPFCGGQIK